MQIEHGREPDRTFLVNIQQADNTEALETGVIGIFRINNTFSLSSQTPHCKIKDLY